MRRALISFLLLTTIAAACGGADVDFGAIEPLPATEPEEVAALLAAADTPIVLNVWASWCIPCRSEAPLLDRAAARFADRVRFIGINVRDDQDGARSFIAEFLPDAAIEHFADPAGRVPPSLGGGTGVPLTFFFTPGGGLVELHYGVIDERSLALQIDELLARS